MISIQIYLIELSDTTTEIHFKVSKMLIFTDGYV